MTSRCGSRKQHLEPLTTLRESVVREILSWQTMSINIAILRRLLHVLPLLLIGHPDHLFWDPTSKVVLEPPTLLYPNVDVLGVCESLHICGCHSWCQLSPLPCATCCQRTNLQPAWTATFLAVVSFEPVVDLLAELHLITAVLASSRYLISCLAVIFHMSSPSCSIHQIITGCRLLIFIPVAFPARVSPLSPASHLLLNCSDSSLRYSICATVSRR